MGIINPLFLWRAANILEAVDDADLKQVAIYIRAVADSCAQDFYNMIPKKEETNDPE